MTLRAAFALAITAGLPSLAVAQTAYFDPLEYKLHRHTLYVDGNIASGNAILAYDIHEDGSLHALPQSPFKTGGQGFVDPSFALGPFDIDQEMAITNDVLYAVNAGSNSVSAMEIGEDGALYPLPHQPFSSHGSTPISLGVHWPFLVMLNSAQDPAQAGKGYVPGLAVSAILPTGELSFIGGSVFPLAADAQPSQALTTNTGPFVYTAEFPGGGRLDAFFQFPNGQLALTDSIALPLEAKGVQPLPLGLAANPVAPFLYVGFVNTGEVGVYSQSPSGKLDFVTKAASSGKAVCWLRVSKDGRFLYSSNTADESMSVYDLSDPSRPVEIQHIVVGGTGGVQQFSLTPDGHFLYLLQQENSAASVGGGNHLYVLKVNTQSGLLTLLDNDTVTLPVPTGTRPFGVAIR